MIAFCAVTQAELDNDTNDINEWFSDCQYYVEQAARHYSKSSIAFHQIYDRSFRVRRNSVEITFHEKQRDGYYFAAPGKEPRVFYGIMPPVDLYPTARAYFKTKGK